MSNIIEDRIDDLQRLTKSQEIKDALAGIQALLLQENQFNIEAMCPVGTIEEETLDISDFQYIEDYEILTGQYTVDGVPGFPDEVPVDDKDEVMERVGELIEKIEAKESEVEELIERLDLDLSDTEDEAKLAAISATIDRYNEAAKKLTEHRKKLEDYKWELDRADLEYDEIYWDTVYRYRGSVNVGLANRIGFGVLEFNHSHERHSDEQWMFLTGCGQDMSPQMLAYQALQFGYIDPSYVRKLREPSWCKHILGGGLFRVVTDRLGITQCVEPAEDEAKRKMEQFDKEISSISKLRQEGMLDQPMAGLLAMMAFFKAEV